MTAEDIIKLVLETATKTGTKKFTDVALEKSRDLLEKIRQRLQGKAMVETALQEPQKDHSKAILEHSLQEEMSRDSKFAKEVSTLAEQVKQNIQQSQEQTNFYANAYDQSTIKQVGKIEAEDVSF